MTTQTKKFKFNILDVVIIIVAIACVAGLAIRANLADTFSAKEQEAIVTFRVSGILKNSVDVTFLPGDAYYCKTMNAFFGYFGEVVERTPASLVSQDKDGIARESSVPYRQDIKATMTCKGSFDGDEFFIDGTNRVIPGQTYEIYSRNRRMTIQVVSVEPAK
ncbi:MAG: DUF4330 family protein [Clostridia bacterium]|nr:DUF4330 family protein [Clostridia bacterium]